MVSTLNLAKNTPKIDALLGSAVPDRCCKFISGYITIVIGVISQQPWRLSPWFSPYEQPLACAPPSGKLQTVCFSGQVTAVGMWHVAGFKGMRMCGTPGCQIPPNASVALGLYHQPSSSFVPLSCQVVVVVKSNW